MEINETTEKKAYIAPQLTVYGAVKDLTTGGSGTILEVGVNDITIFKVKS